MALRERLDQDLKAAMLAKDAPRVSALRMVKAAVRNKEIDAKSTLDDTGMIQILSALKKQREDAIALYRQGDREDLAAKETAELDIVKSYLPQELSHDELRKIIGEAIAEAGAAGPKDMGKVMKALMPKTQGRADGKWVSEQVKAALTEKEAH